MIDECIVLTDVGSNQWVDHYESSWGAFEIKKQTLHGGRSEGVDLIEIQCNGFYIHFLPTRGMSIHRAGWHAATDESSSGVNYGWDSPVGGPVHPSWVPVGEPSGLGWLDGFDELLVRCGLSSNGAPEFDPNGGLVHPLHGRIGNLPASRVELRYDHERNVLKIMGQVIESRFHFAKWRLDVEYELSADSGMVSVTDRVTNIGGSEQAFQMLYHYNIGGQLLNPGGQILIAAHEVVPRNDHSASCIQTWDQVEPPQAGFAETVYFVRPAADERGSSIAAVIHPDGTQAAGVRYDATALPCFSLWKNFAAREDGYVVGLEPGTNYPNTRGFESDHNRVVPLNPGESKELRLELIFANSRESVEQLKSECNLIQTGARPELASSPQAGLCE